MQYWTEYKFQRDYVAGDADNSMSTNQYVFVLDDAASIPVHAKPEREYRSKRIAEDGGAGEDAPPQKRAVAYWHPVGTRYILRPKRLRVSVAAFCRATTLQLTRSFFAPQRNEKRRYDGIWDRLKTAPEETMDAAVKKRWRQRREVDDLPHSLWNEVDESDEEEEEAVENAGVAVIDDSDSGEADVPAKNDKASADEDEDDNKDKGSDSEDDDDEEMDEDELAGLREEAGEDGDAPAEPASGRRGRRAAAVAAEATTARDQANGTAADEDDE